MQFFRYERDPRDIEAVQQFADSILSAAEEQALSNAKQIIEHDEMQDDKEVIIRARNGLVDALAEIKRTQKVIERYILKLDEFLSDIAEREKDGEKDGKEAQSEGGQTKTKLD
ncbi:hypothetical protein CcaverHIS002_0104140 [Cutaneotrichosporon cavernicola]|uniref:Uncharacterized protein n=1 Tax=Cutaneotrichosporon cavernicola TaxID=279322 RepID=A0AA48I188_9TREE|nr:uncharacterized protein CcaverHIS019_0104070 [Cutaneotrichosporon cavernicola]BEI79885.1 hypothetical protein CcaverHIS002_0104140 [Cutaneotrichosporon cavernicola]BEI87689.1 hypothetical protein CcaverHIS019_0104070 [Cutaneotrichosporon cavernicola]BEI95461.1 hypothetical protein CcaverHIS631_0104100 [Cutaneotrichosporon cavernicola]